MLDFKKNIISQYGEKGQKWLNNLPNLIAQTAESYKLSNLKPLANLSYNYVLTGFQDSKAIILKLGLDIDGFKRETSALMAFSGLGAVEVLSENNGLLLLERAVPGVSLKSYFPKKEDEAINITANIIKQLHKAPIPSQHAFPHIKDWLTILDLYSCTNSLVIQNKVKNPANNYNGSVDNLLLGYIQKARKLRDNLLKTSAKDVLLHGDLHHDNILQNGNDKSRRSPRSEDGWFVIDPKGVIGEPAYEVAAFIRNPIPELLAHNNTPNIILNRVTRFAELLELPSGQILDWCFVQSVLSWVWAIEDLSPEALAQGDACDTSYFEQLTKVFGALIFND